MCFVRWGGVWREKWQVEGCRWSWGMRLNASFYLNSTWGPLGKFEGTAEFTHFKSECDPVMAKGELYSINKKIMKSSWREVWVYKVRWVNSGMFVCFQPSLFWSRVLPQHQILVKKRNTRRKTRWERRKKRERERERNLRDSHCYWHASIPDLMEIKHKENVPQNAEINISIWSLTLKHQIHDMTLCCRMLLCYVSWL